MVSGRRFCRGPRDLVNQAASTCWGYYALRGPILYSKWTRGHSERGLQSTCWILPTALRGSTYSLFRRSFEERALRYKGKQIKTLMVLICLPLYS